MKNEHRLINKISRRLTILPIIGGLIILPLSIFALFTLVTSLSPETYAFYNDLMVSAGIKKSDIKTSPYQVKQQRTRVQKDILFAENESRLQLRLLADDSQMVLDHNDGQTAVIEQMNKVVCYMQEELYFVLPNGDEALFSKNQELRLRNQDPAKPESYVSKDTQGLKPMQIIRFMKADKGTYYYKSDLFYAESVKIERFIMNGHEFNGLSKDKKKIMDGIADSVEFSLDGKNINFKAGKLKASFYAPAVSKGTK
jgi:hypothetical protein